MLIAATLALTITARPDARPQDRVDGDRLLQTIRDLPTRRSPSGTAEHIRGLAETEAYLITRLKDLGLEPTLQDLEWRAPAALTPGVEDPHAINPDPWRNIIVDLPGTDLPHEVLILSGHFDAVPKSPGADDDASGTAAILELARVLKDLPTRRTIRLIFFNLEEVGMRGSGEYVASIRERIHAGEERIVGMASLEMIGYFSDEEGSQQSPIKPVEGVFEPPTVGNFIGMAGIARHKEFSQRLGAEMRAAAPDLPVVVVDFMPIPFPDMLRSDNAPFLIGLGAPAVMITDTSNFRNPNYHAPTDTVETLDAARFTFVVRALAGAAYAIAEPAQANAPPQGGAPK